MAPAVGRRDHRLEPGERRRRLVALTTVLVLHLLFAVAAYRAAQLHRPGMAPAPPAAGGVMHLRLIDAGPDPIAAPAAPPMPMPMPMPSVSSSAPPRAAAGAATAIPPTADAAATSAPDRGEPAPRWIDRSGAPRMPAPVAAPRTFSNRPLREADAPDPLAHRSPLPYAPTRFEKYWAPRDETLGGQWLREHTVSRTVDLPQGYQLRCTWMLILGGCGWGKAPQATIEELRAMRADPPMPRSVAGRVDAAPAAPDAQTPGPATPQAARPLDLSLPPPLVPPAPPPGGR
ncbi:MAG: hypothetical protein DI564_03020 [Rhodanobacter denitrificans]|uniref:Uncharacterized protein n=1 Tax=Rhodanobacter denitrificans TaxID=666685 RepID=A0A2W5MX58_9GAMM|nr:MAG: hypothetical protein DI564_03020 [Rhodanobacter denitrificans]